MNTVVIRTAAAADIPAIAAIYERIHDMEESGRAQIGWIRGVYPTAATAEAALAAGDLFVLEADGRFAAAARINRTQVPAYAACPWRFEAADDEVMVLHTLVVDPEMDGLGLGSRFVAFYEDYARAQGCAVLRMDTNARNLRARRMYAQLGCREAGIVPCTFNGIPSVQLVCLEKRLEAAE